jgi:2-enoate reductase
MKVTLVDLQDGILKVGGPLCHANEDILKDLINYKDIYLRLNTAVTSATDNGFILKSGDKQEVIEADSAIVCIGYVSEKSLYYDIRFEMPKIHLLGDASQVQKIMYAI